MAEKHLIPGPAISEGGRANVIPIRRREHWLERAYAQKDSGLYFPQRGAHGTRRDIRCPTAGTMTNSGTVGSGSGGASYSALPRRTSVLWHTPPSGTPVSSRAAKINMPSAIQPIYSSAHREFAQLIGSRPAHDHQIKLRRLLLRRKAHCVVV
jgi:hypothetical protein